MRQVSRFDVRSVMKLSAVVYGLLGLVEGVIFALIGIGARSVSAGSVQGISAVFGMFGIVLFPVLGAVFGAIGGGLGAVVYNFAAKRVGGIRVEVAEA